MRSYDLPSHELQPNTLQTVIIHVHVIIHVLLHNVEDKYFQIDSNLQYNRITSKTFIAFRCIMFYSLTEPLMLAQLLNKKSSCNSSLPLHLSPAPRLRFGKFRLSNCALLTVAPAGTWDLKFHHKNINVFYKTAPRLGPANRRAHHN